MRRPCVEHAEGKYKTIEEAIEEFKAAEKVIDIEEGLPETKITIEVTLKGSLLKRVIFNDGALPTKEGWLQRLAVIQVIEESCKIVIHRGDFEFKVDDRCVEIPGKIKLSEPKL